jgi:hypothetical protein
VKDSSESGYETSGTSKERDFLTSYATIVFHGGLCSMNFISLFMVMLNARDVVIKISCNT